MPVLTAEYAAGQMNLDLEKAGPAFESLVEAVNDYIESETGRKFDKAEHTEWHDMKGACGDLWVRNPPINSITSLTDDANTDEITNRSNRAITVTSCVEAHADWLRLVNTESVFAAGQSTAKIVYVGGYAQDDMPRTLQMAAAWIAAAWWEGQERLTRQSQNIDGQAIVWRPGVIPEEAQKVLNRYKLPLI